MSRPTIKELNGKLKSAKQAINAGQIHLLNQPAFAVDAIELGYSIDFELTPVLVELIDETSPSDYCGTRPPRKSYEQEIKGLELFAFSVMSNRFKCRIYYKFAVKRETVWLVSLHEDRPPKEHG